MHKQIFIFSQVILLTFTLHAQQPEISYDIAWSQPNSHFLEITMTIKNWTADSLDVRIPAWRPGRYVIQNYAKNIIEFQALTQESTPLPHQKLDKGTWRIQNSSSQTILVKYKYYARQLDAGSSYLDDSEAYINPISCLMYIPGKELLPVSLSIQKPVDWKIAAALDFDESQGAFVSENYHELVDAPILISPAFNLLTFQQKDARIEIALQGKANYDEKKIVEDIRKIVVEQCKIMKDIPFKRYLFMYHLVPYRFGHGVEHKNSTSIVRGPADFDNEKYYDGFLGVTAHEFFHAWNVERIRPEAIYHPDYSKENYTTTMWLYEGITSYYADLTLIRTHQVKKKKYFENWARRIRGFQNLYGRKLSSVSEASWESWTKGYGNAPPNTSFSFYAKGNILGMLLDLEIRQRTKNKKSLDNVMRYLNESYAKQNRGVPEDGFQKAIQTVTKSGFEEFFADYVHGTEEMDYNRFLKYAGLELKIETDKKAPKVYFGISTSGDEKQTKISNVAPESPAFKAGLDSDDILLAIDSNRAHKSNLDLLLKKYSPGDTIRVSVFRRSELHHFDVELAEALPDKYEIKEIEESSRLQKKIRKSWLNEEEAEN